MTNLAEDTLKTIDRMFKEGKKITFSAVCNEAQVSRRFLYNHEVIVERIKYYQLFDKSKIQDNIKRVEEENKRLEQKLTQYEDLLISLIEKQGSH